MLFFFRCYYVLHYNWDTFYGNHGGKHVHIIVYMRKKCTCRCKHDSDSTPTAIELRTMHENLQVAIANA